MKFAHLADTHLGYRQYGLIEREKDFYEVFEKVIDRIIEEKVDFVIHSGDLFETATPSPLALFNFQKGLLKLKGAGIPMYSIAGDHDMVMRKGAIPPQVIFKKMGLKVLSKINPLYMHDDVFIAGLPYHPSSNSKTLKTKLAELSKKASKHEKSILILHQGIYGYSDYDYELELDDIPDNFNYYALGHIHKYVTDNFGKGKLVYPGSVEIWKTSELQDYKEHGKGFVLVDLDGPKPRVKRVKIDIPREFIRRTIEFDDLERHIAGIKETIKDFDKKPILDLEINNIKSDPSNVYNIINDELGEFSLMIRPTFNMVGEKSIDEIILQKDSLNPKDLIIEHLENYDDEVVNTLAVELYELLSKDKIEESGEIINLFYEQYYSNIKDDVEFKVENLDKEETLFEEPDDVQIKFNEVLK